MKNVNISGVWKKRFPIITCLRSHYDNALEIIMATAVLHNLSILWKDPLPEADHPDAAGIPAVPPQFQDGNRGVLPQNAEVPRNRVAIRAEGDAVRERLRENMPPATPQELRRMRRIVRNH